MTKNSIFNEEDHPIELKDYKSFLHSIEEVNIQKKEGLNFIQRLQLEHKERMELLQMNTFEAGVDMVTDLIPYYSQIQRQFHSIRSSIKNLIKYGVFFSDEQTWSVSTTMYRYILPRIKRMREIEVEIGGAIGLSDELFNALNLIYKMPKRWYYKDKNWGYCFKHKGWIECMDMVIDTLEKYADEDVYYELTYSAGTKLHNKLMFSAIIIEKMGW